MLFTMVIRITVSKSTCLLLGAALGVTLAFIIPSSVDADSEKKRQKKNHEHKNAATNTSKINHEKESKFYGDKTMSYILEKAKSGIRKIWNPRWKVVLMNSKNVSKISTDVFVDAQTSLPKTDSKIREIFDPIHHSDEFDSMSTIYTPVGELNVPKHSSITSKVKKGLNDIAIGYKRANTSKNDNICKNFPRQSTLIESAKETTIEENVDDENAETTDTSSSSSESDGDKKLVLSFRTPFSPVIKVIEAVKKFSRARKRAKEKSDANVETNNDNDIEEVVET